MSNNDFTTSLHSILSLEIKEMDALIDNLLKGKHLIQLISEHLIYSGGKRLRPCITILIAKLFGYIEGKKHINLAASIEFIHTATLLHDDVVDESNLRRGKKTSNNIWGNQSAILVGDYLLSQAFQLMVEQNDIEILRILSRTSSIIAEGEILQLSYLSNFIITEAQYLQIIKAKTAELFAAAASVGALIASQNSNIINESYNFGLKLGMGFQILDDIMDYSSSSSQMGKEVGNDFREGKITLPILISYAESNEEDKKFLEDAFNLQDKNQHALEKVIEIIKKNDAINKSYIKAKQYIDQSRIFILSKKNCIEKELLLHLLDFSLKRVY